MEKKTEKMNGLRLLHALGAHKMLPTKDLMELIVKCMENDRDLSNFVIEQTKFLLFINEGNGNPTEEELAIACTIGVYSIATHFEGAMYAYDIYLEKGVDAFLETIRGMLFDDKENGKVG